MLNRIFPKTFDNVFRGHWLAIVLLAAIALMKLVQGVNSILFTHMVATTADGLAVDSFSPIAVQTVLSIFALVGFYLMLVPLQCIVVLIRYRSMIPFLYLMLLVMQLGGRLVLFLDPVPRSSAFPMGVIVNLGILAATLIGFALSLTSARERAIASPDPVAR
jgi:hypothetical protein